MTLKLERSAATAAVLLLLSAVSVFAQKGKVTGGIFDAANGNPIRNATVEAATSPPTTTVTDLDGSYELQLSPGVYTITIRSENYITAEISGLVVEANAVVDGSTVMGPAGEVTQVEVTATIDAAKATAESVILERKLSSTVSDAISAEDISKSTASDAAGALEKVTGVSIGDGGYVFVRGLGERYSATMLNNAMLTTTEPEKRVVPLDLFPAGLIDSIKVVKTYSADLPGEFSGGLVQLKTVEFPVSPILRVSMSTGYNTQTSGADFQTYGGGGRDFFGFDDGSRAQPSSIPEDQRLNRANFNDEELAAFGRGFNPDWEVNGSGTARLPQSYSILAGNTFGKLGIVGAISFTNELSRYPESWTWYRTQSEGVQRVWTDYPDYRADRENPRMGGILNLSYRFTPAHKLSIRNTITRDSEKEGRLFTGFSGGVDEVISNERLRWVERNIVATQIEGEHLTGWRNSLFRWQMGISKSHRDEPDLRDVSRVQRNPDEPFQFLATPSSGIRFFSNLDETIYEPLGEFSVPFYKGPLSGSFNVGFRATFRDRTFDSRRFRFTPSPGSNIDLTLPTNQIFAPENIGNGIQLREITRNTDAYTADMTVYGGFFNLDMAIGPKWRVVAGLRVEDAEQNVVTDDPLNPFGDPVVSSLVNRDPLPAVNLIYALTSSQNLRFGWGQTLSRPDFRELSPFEFTDVIGGFATAGNANLVRSSIQNFDARWEWFFGGDQLFALSYFYKKFTDPIELVLEPGITQRRTWVNADGAKNQGIEVEWRRNLGSLTPSLREFSMSTNFTFVDSNIEIPADINTPVTNLSRPLLGQSRYLFNFVFEWAKPRWRSNTRMFLNHHSRRISDVGSFGLQDIYFEGRTTLDVVYEYQLREKGDYKIRFGAENLTDADYLWTQGGDTHHLFRSGRSLKVGFSFSPIE